MKQNKLSQKDVMDLKWRIKGRQIVGVSLFWRYCVVPPFSSEIFGREIMAQHISDIFLWKKYLVLLLEDWAIVMINRPNSTVKLQGKTCPKEKTIAQIYLDDQQVLCFIDNRRDGYLILLPIPKYLKKGRTMAPSL
ncbi:hypothetical protein D3H64_00970 [Atopobacter sp. AH10]|uniref:DNA-formamidopyrimidine glycosylase family protein n=1 Tax=Atopobacter sp. AH10 TaxID=2315861 RepID=UPI000EF1B954|nr:DNA-formamidopyrimidine glycosylase family protein [Atopobacter sp. AH10]RLK64129.1 hypothetical protein D3H64_00970 [Atopobacter sp. AH10]